MTTSRTRLLRVFLPFAIGYFFSYLYRVVNAVIAPNLVADLERIHGRQIFSRTGIEPLGNHLRQGLALAGLLRTGRPSVRDR